MGRGELFVSSLAGISFPFAPCFFFFFFFFFRFLSVVESPRYLLGGSDSDARKTKLVSKLSCRDDKSFNIHVQGALVLF